MVNDSHSRLTSQNITRPDNKLDIEAPGNKQEQRGMNKIFFRHYNFKKGQYTVQANCGGSYER